MSKSWGRKWRSFRGFLDSSQRAASATQADDTVSKSQLVVAARTGMISMPASPKRAVTEAVASRIDASPETKLLWLGGGGSGGVRTARLASAQAAGGETQAGPGRQPGGTAWTRERS